MRSIWLNQVALETVGVLWPSGIFLALHALNERLIMSVKFFELPQLSFAVHPHVLQVFPTPFCSNMAWVCKHAAPIAESRVKAEHKVDIGEHKVVATYSACLIQAVGDCKGIEYAHL